MRLYFSRMVWRALLRFIADCSFFNSQLNIFILQVYTEGRLIVEFNFDDLMRIRSWHFAIRNHRELIPRSVIAMQVREIFHILYKLSFDPY